MSEKPDGGSAFPNDMYGTKGMSLRDFFAAKAIVALHIVAVNNPPALGDPNKIARLAYTLADAMLVERED
jgi:hypothetical protein